MADDSSNKDRERGSWAPYWWSCPAALTGWSRVKPTAEELKGREHLWGTLEVRQLRHRS